jgi:hypothetical protein
MNEWVWIVGENTDKGKQNLQTESCPSAILSSTNITALPWFENSTRGGTKVSYKLLS